MNPVLQRVLEESRSADLRGREHQVTGAVDRREVEFLQALIQEHSLRRCAETGVAFGVSTAAICDALSRLGGDCMHYGVDPCQHTEYGGACLALLERCGLAACFELLEGPAHLMLPRLIERGERLDLFLVDGWHTFDYTLVDVFLADKLLRPGGFLLIHDMFMRSKQKVAGFLEGHRRYRVLPGPDDGRSTTRRLLSVGKGLATLRPRRALLSARQLAGLRNLYVARKLEDWEPPHDFYARF